MKKFGLSAVDMPSEISVGSLADILRWRAETIGDRDALTFLADGINETARLTYGRIDESARGVAAMLQQNGARGESVILLFEPGPEFIIAFLGCIYAGARGVPLYPPDVRRLNRTLPRFLAIVEDCRAEIILTTSRMKQMGAAVFEFAPQLAKMRWLAADDIPAGLHREWKSPSVSADEICFLQYTSGSTGDPKGVEVSHRSLLLNLAIISDWWGSAPGEATVTWLPNYHDMGLIDGWLRPLYLGCRSTNMPPVAFLKNPYAWLRAISMTGAAVSGAPNFAYELCISKITDAELAGLDLSRWRAAYCGAEPVRAETIKRFTRRFGRCGFRPEAFCPAYGLAEATLVVSIAKHTEPPVMYSISRSGLESNRVAPIPEYDPDSQMAIGVGKPGEYVETIIVDPETRSRCPAGVVGEIWTAGPTMARGYMNRPEINREVFEARLDTGEGPYLRTGDLGFMREDGELFIGGRRKDLIIIRGRNHYPQDIEKTVEEADRSVLRPGCNAAFSVDADGEERLVVVAEMNPRLSSEPGEKGVPRPFGETFQAVRAAVAEEHGVDPHAIVVIKPGSIPKTSSGKIQRRTCREGFLKGGLEIVAQWRAGGQERAAAPEKAAAAVAGAGPVSRDTAKGARIRAWLKETLSKRLSIQPEGLDENRPFAQLGLDSREGIVLVGDLEKWLGTELPVSVIYDHPSINRLVRHLEGRSEALPHADHEQLAAHEEPIAIVGIGCRFPGADGPAAFWELLKSGADAVIEIPPDRWNRDAWYDPDPSAPGKMVSKYGGFLRGIDRFDPQAFDITVREAARMDPQQRLLLEVTSEALENAGITPRACAGSRTGVFVGISSFDYGRHLLKNTGGIDAYYGTGAALSIAANRISYQFDFHGPSVAVDTACSSSLVAVHAAVASLRRGECSMAVAGGVNVVLLPEVNVAFTKAGVLSPHGHCRTFDARADGITRAEGAGAVILKPLSKAIADGDHVWAVVKGSAVNSDGRSNGLMAPNGMAQQAVVAEACRDAGVDPKEIQYVEAHGTGTVLGDPIEVDALAAVLSKDRAADRPCRIGSVKSNLGHLEAAAGIAGLVKVAMALRNRELVPTIQYSEPNPGIRFERLKMSVQTRGEPWPAPPGSGLAGVSSFGFGGTNAHVVLGEAPPAAEKSPPPAEGPVLVPLSARSEDGLRALAGEFRRFVEDSGAARGIAGVAVSASQRRTHFNRRLAVEAGSRAELLDRLSDFIDGRHHEALSAGEVLPEASRKVAFVFPGQGGQWWAMGRELMETAPAFMGALEELDSVFRPMAGWSLTEELLKGSGESRVNETEFLQPMLFAVEAALCACWRSLGIEPDAVVGHSMGEVAAAHACGKLTTAEALRLIMHRGRIMSAARGKGAMTAVELSLVEAEQICGRHPGRLSVAANNSPNMSVIAGEPEAVGAVARELQSRGVFCRELRVEVAGHSPDMEPLREPLAAAAGEIPFRSPRMHIVSTVTGGPADALELDAAYWARNIREPVRFRNAVEVLLSQGFRTFVELGPHPALKNAILQTAAAAGVEAHALHSLKRETPERATLLSAAGALHVLGFPVDFTAVNPGGAPAVPLPATPWDRQRCWVDLPSAAGAAVAGGAAVHPLLTQHVESPSESGVHLFETVFDLHALPWIADHRVQNHAVFPATGYVELVRAACDRAFGGWGFTLEEISFNRVLILAENSGRTVSTVLRAGEGGTAAFSVFSRPERDGNSPWTLHVSGSVLPGGGLPSVEAIDPAEIRKRCGEEIGADGHYGSYLGRSIDYRGAFRSVRTVRRRDGEALGEVSLDASHDGRFNVHPGLLDACLQVMAAALPGGGQDASATYMPVGIEGLTILRTPPQGVVLSHAVLKDPGTADAGGRTADVILAGADGAVWGMVRGLRVRRVDSADSADFGIQDWLYRVEWRPLPRRDAGGKAAAPGARWMVFADGSPFAAALVRELAARRADFVTVKRGAAFNSSRASRFEVDPFRPNDLERMVDEVSACGRPVTRILFMWGMAELVSERKPDAVNAADLLRSQSGICSAVVMLVRALAKRKWQVQPSLWLVTKNAEPVKTGQAVSPAQSALWGLGRSVALEQAQFWGGLIDIDEGTPPSMLLAEIDRPGADDQIAFRDDRRFVPRLVHQPPRAPMLKALCSSDGMYLVTGGLGALGIGIARWLVGHGARHVMLTGRSAFPERASWPGLAAEGDRRAAGLLDLEKSGAKFTIVRADASDYEAMNKALSGAGMALKGIVHAAGTVTPKEVLELEAADIESDMRAKVAGAWVLHQLSQRHRPDFFIMFSSASAIWGSKLLAGYGAANHFLDGLAQMRRGMGQPALSVNWAMWGDGGMAIGGGHDRMLMRMGMRPMPPVKAFAVLDELAGAGDAQAAVADVDWSVLKPLYEQGPRRRLLELIKFAGRGEGPEGRGPQGGESGLLASIRANPDPDAVKAAVAGFVIRQAAEVLGVPPEKVDATKPLTAQGLDSLNAGELRGRIQKTLNVRIDVLSLLKGDSPEQVGWRVMEKLSGALAEASAGPDAETLDDDIRAAGAEPAHEGAPREILLTGATGFLGVHMLADLLGRTGARVHCLVKAVRDTEAMDRVRSKMEEAGLWRSGMMGRLSAVAGDLSQPRLGLTSARWDLLARSVDVIHHAGYAVNFLFSYEDMRAANVLSLKELLRLAAGPRVKPVHFVSSFSVLLTREYAGKSIGDYETLFPAEGGYREGKRACERLIGEARRRGVPVGIYRPPFIGWRGDTGYYNERDFLIKLMRGCIDLGSAPDLDILFYITPVDYIASSIIRLSLEPSAANGNFNVLSSPRGLPWKDLVGLLRQAGAAIEIEPFALWREKLDKAGPSNPLHVFFPALGADVEERGSAVLDLFSAGSAPSEIRLDGLRKFLGDPPPETAVDEELVRAFVERVKKG